MRTLSDIAQEGQDLHPLDFAAIVAEKLGTAEGGEAPTPADTVADEAAPVEEATPDEQPADAGPDETYVDEGGRLRRPDGTFAPKAGHDADPDATPDPAATPEPDEWVLDVDEDVQAYLEKYGGDLNKALRGAVEAQSLIGRKEVQGENYQRLEQELRALRSEIEYRQQAAAQPQVPMPNYRELIEDDPREAAVTAYDNQHWDAMGAAIRAWAEEDPTEARLFAMNVKHEADLMEMRALQAQSQEAQSSLTSQSYKQEFTARVADIVARHPDLKAMLPVIGQVSQERPLLREALETGSPEVRASALEDLYFIAKSRSVEADTSAAVRQVQVRVSDEAREARAAASVLTGSGSSAAAGDSPTRVDQFRSAFKDKLREQGLYGDEPS